MSNGMETMMPTSFIPKRPVSTEPVAPSHKSHAVGLLSLLASIVVIATIVSYAGVYVYTKRLATHKIKTDQQIDVARNGIGTQFLGDMKRLNARIDGVKSTIQQHIVVTPIFAALEQTTLRSIQYKSFSYSFIPDPLTNQTQVQVSLTGTAKGYATIALQSDAFTQNTLIKNPIFSNLTVDDKTSAVNFKLVFTVNPAALSYGSFIANLAKDNGAGVVDATPVTSSTQ